MNTLFNMYNEEEMLMLSGIQHFMFCPRQWALIHIEQLWDENRLTAEGKILHKHVDDPFYRQKIGDIITLRSVSISSKSLGLYGVADIVELHPTVKSENSIKHPSYIGWWKPFPIEYKRGRQKSDERDEVQLTAQIICLEEMYGIKIDSGALYYAETNRREIVNISESLRLLTIKSAKTMHKLYKNKIIPKPTVKHCKNCSLINVCMPDLHECQSVNKYLKKNLYEETT